MATQTKLAHVRKPTKVFVPQVAPKRNPTREVTVLEANLPASEKLAEHAAPAASNDKVADQTMQEWLASDEAAFMMGM